MFSNCPVCGNEITHGKYDGVCKFCKKPYKVVINTKGKKKFYYLEENDVKSNNDKG